MHPVFAQPLKFLSILCAWLLIVISFIFLQKSFIGGAWSDLLVLSGPPMIFLFFIILSNYFIAKTVKLRNTNIYFPIFKHITTAILIVGFWLLLSMLYCNALDTVTKSVIWREMFNASTIIYGASGLLFYFIGLLLHYLYLESEHLHRVEQQALDNKLLAARAELNNLKMSIHPHFLFNSFTALHTLIRTAPEKAAEITLQLATFLRHSLNYAKIDWTTVSAELELVNGYLNIEKIRLENRLNLDFDIEGKALDYYIPPFTLLPLIENAVKHGIEQIIDGGTIHLRILDEGHSLLLTTSNPVNSTATNKNKNGFGLHALQKRFSAAYSEKIVFNTSLSKTEYTLSFRLPILQEPTKQA